MCLFLRDSTTHVYSGCKRELSSGKRGQTEHKGPHRTAGNLLGGGNFLSGVRERFLTFSFLSPARAISELCSSAHPMQGTRLWQQDLPPAQVPIPRKPSAVTWALPSHLGVEEQPEPCCTRRVRDWEFSLSSCRSACYSRENEACA